MMYYHHLWHQDFEEASGNHSSDTNINKENDTSLANQHVEQMSVYLSWSKI